jgi:hypothetical protein
MVQTVAPAPVARPFVSMVARCTYCPASTSFRCLNCGTAICPDCVPGDLCPACWPAPVSPLMGWGMVNAGNGADDATFYAVACIGCGETFSSEEPDDELCAACLMPADELAALRMTPAPARRTCAMCAGILAASDDTRCAVCARFMARLDAKHAAWKEERLAA